MKLIIIIQNEGHNIILSNIIIPFFQLLNGQIFRKSRIENIMRRSYMLFVKF